MKVTLTEGISGGFLPAQVRKVIKIDTNEGDIEETQLIDQEYVTKSGKLPSQVLLALTEKVEKLRHLPTEFPPFTSDIYGLDTSIIVEADDFQWGNGAPEGCSYTEPRVTVTSEHKNEFQDTVSEILSTGQYALA
ncbi:hypothetical protein K7432_002589 [Basidiobolus ranarum]|uniref:Uncharacterized protein n=1 Tax=Basidiobolus ranarum TaxID=34480 RepID=A0ABR2W8H4_9FUNG